MTRVIGALAMFLLALAPAHAQDLEAIIKRGAGGEVHMPAGPVGPIVCALIPACHEQPELALEFSQSARMAAIVSYLDGRPWLQEHIQQATDESVQACYQSSQCGTAFKSWAEVTTGLALVGEEPSYAAQPMQNLGAVFGLGSPVMECLGTEACALAADGFVREFAR